MAETTATTGTQTSEFKLATLVLILGTVIDGAGVVLSAVKDSGVSTPWLGPAILSLGVILQVFSLLGYVRSRTMVKLAALQPKASEVAKVLVPFVQEVTVAVKEEIALAKAKEVTPATPPPPSPAPSVVTSG